jgi:PhzF family phenazine biosynthesis protein
MQRRFRQLDVFGSAPFSGNPLAVVVDAEGLTTEQMQTFTRWANLSECTFLLPPTSAEADYLVRIFTLARELPFAGHPTLGSARAWLSAGNEPKQPGMVVQECGAGLVPVRLDGDRLAFAAPPLIRSGPVDDDYLDLVVSILGIGRDDVVDAAWVDNGPGWVGVLLGDADAVLALAPDVAPETGEDSIDIGVVGFHPEVSECLYEVRGFFTTDDSTLREDPVTGSLNASLAQWLVGSGRAIAPYVAAQGTALGRAGRIHIDVGEDGTVWVGGRAPVDVTGSVGM